MNENTVEIDKSEYKSILELAYKATMMKEAMLNAATLDFFSEGLYFGCNTEVATILKYAFPADYEAKLRELIDKKKAEEAEQPEPTTIVKEDVE